MIIMKLCGLIVLLLSVIVFAAPVEKEWILIEMDEKYIDDGTCRDDPMTSNVDEELGNFFEGDMVLTSTQHQVIQYASVERNGLKGITKRWPKGIVLYHIVRTDFDDKELSMIEDAMLDIASKSCLQFCQGEKDEYAVTIQGSAKGCFSSVGYIGGNGIDSDEKSVQVLNLSKGCFNHGTVVHEILHTVGFYHMQSTYDRDEYVKIVWENIQTGREHNFAKYTVDTVTDFGVRYDYGSVMHYTEKAFSKNGNRTIIPLQEGVTIGQRIGLSESDILKLNRMYCQGPETESITYMKP